jgi:hypothetical protein
MRVRLQRYQCYHGTPGEWYGAHREAMSLHDAGKDHSDGGCLWIAVGLEQVGHCTADKDRGQWSGCESRAPQLEPGA